jgi:5-methylthioadenosine/S-adenosylhomocysteine deaminase
MQPAQSTQLIRPRWIAPVTDGSPVLADHAVLVRDGAIAAVAPAAELAAAHPDAATVDLPGHLLVPGLVNAHCHAAMTLLRGAGDDLPLETWLQERIWPLERSLVSDAFVHDGTVLACREMLLGGVTCFSDMYFFPEAVGRAVLAMGMRAVLGIVVFDFPSPYGAGPGDYLSKGLALRDELRNEPRLSFSLSPHAPYTNGDDTLRRIASLAAELQLPVATHLHETAREVSESVARHGLRPIARLDRLGLLGPEFIAIHAVHMDDEDIARLAHAGASLVTCPHSNLKLASGIPRVGAMARAGVNVAVGTDGAASNNRLDLLAEGRLAALLAKAETGDAATMSAHATLHALTRAGAQALGLADRIGSIEPGKRADLVAVDLSAPEYGPVLDPVATLVHAAGREAVTDVWVDGNRVVTERQIADSLSREAVGNVVRASPLWHNRLGEFVSGRAG